ncbi:MAG: long-chain fatty acid--CoA ligase [Polyangia bacterium]
MTPAHDSPLVDWFARRVALGPERIALCDPWGPSSPPPRPPVTYRELQAAARRTARFLADACGVGRGDRVAVLARNRRAYLEVLLGCGLLGAVLQALNWRLAPRELADLLVDGQPRTLLYGPECAELVAPLRQSPAAPRRFVCLDEDGEPPARSDRRGDLCLSERDGGSDAPLWVPRGLGDPWILCYTGGSTGTPKGAVLTHGSVLWNAINTCASWGLGAEDCAILNAPLFHTGGLNVFTTPLLYAGGGSVLCRDFRAEQVLDLLSLPPDPGAPPVSLLFGVPTMFQDLQAHPRFAQARWDRLKLVISGGAPCPSPVFERFFRAGVRFRTGYGLTEAGPNNFLLPDARVEQKPGSVGFPLLHVEAEVVAPDGAQLPAGEVGELRLRGPHLCAGYHGRPDETAAAFRDGWLYTGDLARRDADGCFYIAGRRKEMFISGGENIYPAEIESVLCAHPGVQEAAVLGVPDPRWGEVGLAVVVPRGPLQEAELLAHCHARLGRYKVPRRFVLVAELPRTGAGKVDKAALKARYTA